MTSGVEQLGLSVRPLNGALVNQPPIQVSEMIAKELQLRDGQIVKALVEHGGKHLLLSANERSFRLPVDSIYSAGATISLRYASSIYGRHLLPVGIKDDAPNKATTSKTAGTQPTLPPPLIQLALSYVGKINNSGNGLLDLASILSASGLPALLTRVREENSLGKLRPPQLLSKKMITPRLIADTFFYSGLFSESALKDKSRARLDLKQTLLLLRDSASLDLEQLSRISVAIERIELAQIESLVAQERRELLYRFAIPFQEGGAVQVEIEGRIQSEEEGRAWSVALDTADPALGEVSIKADLYRQGSLEVTFWAEKPSTASLMKNMLPELIYEFEQYQINLGGANVISGRRTKDVDTGPNGYGSFLDLKT